MNLPPVLKQRYLDANGVPLAGGKLYAYQAGTSTPQNTYTDQGGLTANANPLVLDSQGYGSMWLDPTLSYKFILQDSLGNVQWTVDNVVGTLTASSVATISIQDGAVTSAKLASGAVNSAALASDSSVDANRPVNTNNIRNGSITRQKFDATTAIRAPTVQSFTSGTGTYSPTYIFFVTSANATVGATYTNNAQTFTVSQTISGSLVLKATGSGSPLSSGTLTKSGGVGDATIAFSSFIAPSYIRVRMVGGGGGGGGSGTAAGGASGSGGNTTFGTSFLTANGGAGGGWAAAPSVGGTATIGAGASGIAIQGAGGSGEGLSITTSVNMFGGPGGASPFGGAGAGGGQASSATQNAIVNSGSGGGGAGVTGNASGAATGTAGAAGGFVDATLVPSGTYAYAVGAGGTGGAAGTLGYSGGSGGSGLIIVEEFFQ